MSYLYDTDILLWSEQQADLLRRYAAGERVNDAAVDWPNIVEEIEDVGRSARNSVDSPLVHALLHMSLYETDALAWSRQQAGLLRRMAAGEHVSDQLDWPNVIEEIERVGRSELRAVASALQIAIQHKLLLLGWPNAPAVRLWEAEARTRLAEAHEDFRESMRKGINLGSLYRRAVLATKQHMLDEGPPATPLPDQCPFLLDGLLAEGAAAMGS
jgi:hypothetical protein